MGELCKVILWSDGYSSQFRSKSVFALLTHFDRNIALQWNNNEVHHGKGPMDGVGGTIKRVAYTCHKKIKLSSRALSKMLQQLKEPWMNITLSVITIWEMSVFLSSIIYQMIKNLFIHSITLD